MMIYPLTAVSERACDARSVGADERAPRRRGSAKGKLSLAKELGPIVVQAYLVTLHQACSFLRVF
jgi:hypothetical protein